MANIPKPVPVHTNVTTLQQAKDNVSSALSALRSLEPPIAPAIYTCHSDPILKGQFHLVWGLLYHVMEAFQRVPVQTISPLNKEIHRDFDIQNENDHKLQQVADDKILLVEWLRTQGYLDTLDCTHAHPTFDDIKIYAGHTHVLVGLLQDIRRVHKDSYPPPHSIAPLRPLLPSPLEDDDDDDEEEEDLTTGLVTCWHVDTEVHSSHQWRETDIDPSEDLFPHPHDPINPDDVSSRNNHPMTWHNVDEDVVPQPQPFKLTSTLSELAAWLQALHVDGAPPSLDAATLPEFQDGLVLVSLVEKVEHVRRLDGVCRAPRGKRASCLHNISKVMTILSHNKVIPLIRYCAFHPNLDL
ncbi:hypothetical protein DYB30_005792 [Aphanomyces astaci]|uniref:Uncharacterized protein n=1 Tax=Aphanomyces astaci TaxID=112090 RepID=A0A397E5R6_APHAT|nr:hypothetical protein DYB30_005792 [Aphanomyces astaci]